MRKSIFLKRFLSISILLCGLFGRMLFPVSAISSDVESEEVSLGLEVLSAQTDVALSTFAGNDLLFSADLLAKGLNLSSVNYITVHSLPPIEDGELLLGSSKVVSGQKILSSQLSNFNFHPSTEEAITTSFRFSANGSGTVVACNLYFLDRQNAIPTLNSVPAVNLLTNTYQNKTAYATLSAYEPDGDDFRFEIVSYPENGCLKLTDPCEGTYEYRPEKGFTGKDSFRYVARDKYGNYSASATVQLEVEVLGTSISYADMQDSNAENAALKMTECGIMSGEEIGKQYYFHPEKQVSRAEFLIMALQATGIEDLPAVKSTVFADDAEIPSAMKGSIQAAYELGYLRAEEKDGNLYFRPNDTITRAEAAAMLGKILGIESNDSIETFADEDSIPAWAKAAMLGLHEVGIFNSVESSLQPQSLLLRGETAKLLESVMKYHR